MAITVNGQPLLRAMISMPLAGAWAGDVTVPDPNAITGAVAIVCDDGLTLSGTALGGGVFQDTAFVRVVGGAGGLQHIATARHYRAASIRAVTTDLMRASGERLSATSTGAVLGLGLPAWTQRAQAVGAALSSLVSDRRLAPAATWRVLADGSIFIGRETWPEAALVEPVDFQEIDENPAEGWVDLGFEAIRLVPGVALAGRRVNYVEHQVTAKGVRARAWLDAQV